MSGQLNHLPADVIRKLIIDLGYGTEPDDDDTWPMFVVKVPETPNNAGVVSDSAPVNDGRSMIDGNYVVHYGFQVLLRAEKDTTARDKAEDIQIGLDEVLRQTVSLDSDTYEVHSVSRSGGILRVGFEENGRRVFYSLNGLATISLN